MQMRVNVMAHKFVEMKIVDPISILTALLFSGFKLIFK
jgi:hypothetical protein